MSFLARLRTRLSVAAPVFTLAGTLGLASLVYYGDDGRAALTGFAEGAPEAVATLEASRVASISVAVGAEVEPGQLVVTLDTAAVDGEIAIAKAEQVRIEADVRAERSVLGRRLDLDRDALELEARREREDLLRVKAESQALDGELERVKKLVAEHQLVAADLTPLRLRRAELASLATEKPRTLGVLTRQLGAAARRRSEVDDVSSPTSAKLDADLLVVRRRIELLERRRAGHFLRATSRGRVVALDKQPGETAAAGEAIVRLVSPTNRVVVCVPERRALGLREGDAARLWVHGERGAPLEGRTVVLGPIVAELPARCWPTPRLPMWGREITVAIDTPMALVAGESFDVVLDGTTAPPRPASDKGGPVAAPASPVGVPVAKKANVASASAEPSLMAVPPSLARRTRFEPSGVVVRRDENRYLVVSDDTGIKGGPDEGRPWLFAMNGAGAIDPSPIAVTGVDVVDDLEAIAAGSRGELYVLASQSYSKHDRRKPARTALLRLSPRGGGFHVDGEVHLAEELELAPERAAALGLAGGTRSLDVEGMAFHGGALYLGLKAPLDARGEAMIWKVSAPDALFEPASRGAAKLASAGLAAWGHARVDVEVDGRAVPGGISELMFEESGALVLTSTPSAGDRAAGALWRVEGARGGALAVDLVRRFPGRKPEGLAPSLTPGKLMVVFDAGDETPSFLETSWPP
ncbi:MAG: hypothetical protein KF764_01520 [Labilithrix sp.]|nr:hypothetical protein [Labilithrix sp.]